MARPRVLVLRAAGTNCDLESVHAWQTAGAIAERVHVRALIEAPERLDAYQVLMLPGGFSYGDDISAGRILAAQIQRHLIAPIHAFVERGKLLLGVCNGFQVLAKAGLLPHAGSSHARCCTITYNDPPGFQDRWVWLRANDSPCVFLEPGRCYELPIAHGEGRVLFATETERQRVIGERRNALSYVPPPRNITVQDPQCAPSTQPGATEGAPYNPNGSEADIAGLCDETGRILGLMPHPERFVTWTQHPLWTALPSREPCDGLLIFQRAVAYFS